MSEAEDILEKARALYQTALGNYRDALLEVGRMLHRYILARLEEAQAMSGKRRVAMNLSRQAIVKRCEESLGPGRRNRVNDLIRTSMTADLLSGGNLGDLPHGAICPVQGVVYRVGRLADSNRYKLATDSPIVSARERWAVKEVFQESAPALFCRAVTECWPRDRAREEVRFFLKGNSSPTKRQPRLLPDEEEPTVCTSWLKEVRAGARVASPGDLAELCMELVGASEDPQAVVHRLRGLLATWKPAKRRPMMTA